MVLLLLILARDSSVCMMNEKLGISWEASLQRDYVWERGIPVYKFLRQLLNVEEDNPLTKVFAKFKDYRVHFNHFIKVLDGDVLSNAQCLAGLLSRGAAILCADNQESIDIVIEVLMPESPRNPEYPVHSYRIVVIVIQVKSGKKYGITPHWSLCDGMPNGSRNIEGLRPSFGSFSPSPSHRRRREYSSRRQRGRRRSSVKPPAYNIWCAGLSPDVLPQIKAEDQSTLGHSPAGVFSVGVRL